MHKVNDRVKVSKNILLSSDKPLNKKCRQLAGLIRIDSDLKFIGEMVRKALKAENVFLDYQGIIISYRKCFEYDARKACLNENKHLIGMDYEQKAVHDHLIFLGNKHVAHPEVDDYDNPELKLILEVTGIATAIIPSLSIWEPIGKNHLEVMLKLIDLAQKNLVNDIYKRADHIIVEYNSRVELDFK